MKPAYQAKVLPVEEVLAAVRDVRASGKTIVQCHGCFDIVHPGHIRYLEFARRQGDVLIVSLTGDLDVNKGSQRPYIPQELRAENLAALMFVDYVMINEEPTAARLLDLIHPDFYVKGREYEGSADPGFLAEKAVVEGYGGRIIYSSGEIVFSSTELIGTLPAVSQAQAQRLRRLCTAQGITLETIEAIIGRFRDLRVAVVGDLILDRYVLCDALGVAHEGPIMTLVQRDQQRYVGGAAIVARHVAALGGRAFLLTAGTSANDPDPQWAMEVLRDEGVEVQLIEGRPSIVQKTRFLAGETKLFKVDRADRSPLDSVAERRTAAILEQRSKSVDAVILCDFGYGMITGGLLSRVLPTLRRNVATITADVSGGRANLLNFRFADLLCPTEREVRAMLNDYDSGLSSVAWQILQQTQARRIFVTLEKRGLLVFERLSQHRDSPEWSARLKSELLPSFADRVVDQLGCGDALLAAASLALAAGASPAQAAYLGNAAAALEAETVGNQPIEIDRLRAWLTSRRELTGLPLGESSRAVEARAAAMAGD